MRICKVCLENILERWNIIKIQSSQTLLMAHSFCTTYFIYLYTATATEFLKYYLYNFRFEMIFFITVDILGSGFVNIQQFYKKKLICELVKILLKTILDLEMIVSISLHISFLIVDLGLALCKALIWLAI